MWSEYHICTNTEQAIELLTKYDGKARVIAGGTDLLIELEMSKAIVPALIDVTRIPNLCEIIVQDDRILLGAAVTFTRLIASKTVSKYVPHLISAARSIGGKQIQNVATVVGNVVNASPAADSVPPLYTMDALVHGLDSNKSEWELPINEFITGVNETRIPYGGLVTGISMPILQNGWRMSFRKLGLRRSMAISVVNCAIALEVRKGFIHNARIAFGAVAPTIIRADEAENALIGISLQETSLNEAPKLARSAVKPIDDLRASAVYRSQMVENLLRQEIMKLAAPPIEVVDAT